MRNWGFGICAGILMQSGLLEAAVVEKVGRFELDWTNLKVRYYGEHQAEGIIDWQTSSKAALNEGLGFFVNEFPKLRSNYIQAEVEGHRAAAHEVAKTTYISSSDFDSEGSTRHYLESGLAAALIPADVTWSSPQTFETDSLDRPDIPTIVLNLPKKAEQPFAIYEAVDESGSTLWTIESLSLNGFRENLMGRWFDKKDRNFSRFTRNGAVEIDVIAVEKGKLTLPSQAWSAVKSQLEASISQGRIALVQP